MNNHVRYGTDFLISQWKDHRHPAIIAIAIAIAILVIVAFVIGGHIGSRSGSIYITYEFTKNYTMLMSQ